MNKALITKEQKLERDSKDNTLTSATYHGALLCLPNCSLMHTHYIVDYGNDDFELWKVGPHG
jgi:hypothetical protein